MVTLNYYLCDSTKINMINILALINEPLSGSKYHRIYNPLSFLKADFSTKLTEQLCKDYDVIWLNRYIDVQPWAIALWKEKYGFKLVFDMDDSWEVPNTNPSYLSQKEIEPYSKDLCLLADWVTVTTTELEREVRQFNDNASVIPNRIPYGEGQFQIKEETKEEFLNRKIRVGISGSISHLHDWKDIKPWLHKLTTNPLFKENCELVISGIGIHNKMFESYQAKLIPYRPVTDYMQVYNELDIILCPLRDDSFNQRKSSIKTLESACSKTVCILDHLYRDKSDLLPSSNLFVNKESEWFSHVIDLIQDKEVLWDLKEKTSNEIISQCDWVRDALEPRVDIIMQIKDNPPLFPKHHIFSIQYKSDQSCFFWPYLNKVKTVEEKSWRFEYNAMLDIFDNKIEEVKDDEYVGVLSWKFPMKTRMFDKKLERLIKDRDVYTFCRPLPNPSYMNFSEAHHPGLRYLVKTLCDRLGLMYKDSPKHIIYSNFVVAKKHIYKDYVEKVVKPSLELLEGELWDLSNKDSGYKAGLPKDQLKMYTGLDYYPLLVFVIERMWSQYLNNKSYTVKNII